MSVMQSLQSLQEGFKRIEIYKSAYNNYYNSLKLEIQQNIKHLIYDQKKNSFIHAKLNRISFSSKNDRNSSEQIVFDEETDGLFQNFFSAEEINAPPPTAIQLKPFFNTLFKLFSFNDYSLSAQLLIYYTNEIMKDDKDQSKIDALTFSVIPSLFSSLIFSSSIESYINLIKEMIICSKQYCGESENPQTRNSLDFIMIPALYSRVLFILYPFQKYWRKVIRFIAFEVDKTIDNETCNAIFDKFIEKLIKYKSDFPKYMLDLLNSIPKEKLIKFIQLSFIDEIFMRPLTFGITQFPSCINPKSKSNMEILHLFFDKNAEKIVKAFLSFEETQNLISHESEEILFDNLKDIDRLYLSFTTDDFVVIRDLAEYSVKQHFTLFPNISDIDRWISENENKIAVTVFTPKFFDSVIYDVKPRKRNIDLDENQDDSRFAEMFVSCLKKIPPIPDNSSFRDDSTVFQLLEYLLKREFGIKTIDLEYLFLQISLMDKVNEKLDHLIQECKGIFENEIKELSIIFCQWSALKNPSDIAKQLQNTNPFIYAALNLCVRLWVHKEWDFTNLDSCKVSEFCQKCNENLFETFSLICPKQTFEKLKKFYETIGIGKSYQGQGNKIVGNCLRDHIPLSDFEKNHDWSKDNNNECNESFQEKCLSIQKVIQQKINFYDGLEMMTRNVVDLLISINDFSTQYEKFNVLSRFHHKIQKVLKKCLKKEDVAEDDNVMMTYIIIIFNIDKIPNIYSTINYVDYFEDYYQNMSSTCNGCFKLAIDNIIYHYNKFQNDQDDTVFQKILELISF